jgi:FkbM family methyltransferase
MTHSIAKQTLLYLRRTFHPLWRLRRSRIYPALEHLFERTVMGKINGVPHPVAMRRLRDVSWWLGGANQEPETIVFLHRLLQEISVKVFWDVGANLGFYSWLVRSIQPTSKLVLFEPDPLNAELIRQTVGENQLSDVSLIESAVSNLMGIHQFARDSVSGATGRLLEVDSSKQDMTIQGSYAKQNKEVLQVDCCTLDGIVSTGFSAPDLMKVDVENAEYLVVEGAENLFASKKTMLLIEIFDARVMSFLAQHDYEVWLIEENALNYFAAPAGTLTGSELMRPYRKVPS